MSIKNRNLTVGTKLVGKYHKQQHTCQVIQGEGDKLRYKLEDGREFKSPSAAGMAITGHACDGWVFWGVTTATENQPTETQAEVDAYVRESASQTEAGSALAARPEDVPVTDIAPVAPEATTAKTSFRRTPNQRGVSEGQTRWFCAECGESFLAPYGEVPTACPQGHKA
jgi:hypothetical protein